MLKQAPSLSKSVETQLKKWGFAGSDISLDESLFEYGILLRTTTPAPDTSDVQYQLICYDYYWRDTIGPKGNPTPLCFFIKHIWQSEINQAFTDSKEGLLSQCGETEEEWRSLSPIYQIQDITRYGDELDLSNHYDYNLSIGQLMKRIRNQIRDKKCQ
ncbi:MAG: hypothetical protein EOO39_00610 [Cytophagaceae bacterium]|nr:MAG: hypothetical protein EOO39_00610 [Cytophagaceae bacterium]